MASCLHLAFVTSFPQTIKVWLNTSVLGRALEKGLFTYEAVQLREFAQDKHHRIDDVAYGGGGGMILKVEPLVCALESLLGKWKARAPKSIFFGPRGPRLDQTLLQQWTSPSAPTDCFILFCGHYEGVDQRFIDHWIDYELSLGDFIVTGGEIAAIAFADAMIRLVDGVLDSPARSLEESFTLSQNGTPLLEYPHYTRPSEFRGHHVPQVLRSGNHREVAKWRLQRAADDTKALRPDLYAGL